MSEAIVTDKTLTIEDAPADAKATGDAINNLRGAVGSPLVAATAASMTDTNKVYVYTGSETGYTSGNWYYYNGTSWVSGGVYNSVAVDLDSTLTLANKAPDSKVVGDAIGLLNEDITNLIKTPEQTEADFYICDPNGNVLAEFRNGHFHTKNFDSADALTADDLTEIESDISSLSETVEAAPTAQDLQDLADDVGEVISDVSRMPEIKTPTIQTADLYVVDLSGNVLIEFSNGHIKTKNFDSANSAQAGVRTVNNTLPDANGNINVTAELDPTELQTAVDEFLTENPVVASAAGIVSVADYGAVGDGITDDSIAIQSALNANYDVYFESDKTYYLASTVTVTHDVKMHGGKNTKIITKTPSGGTVDNGFVFTGTLKKTTSLTTDYTSEGDSANCGNRFTLTDMTNIEIGDILIITATDQFYSYARQYYYLGGVLLISDIYDGHIYTNSSFPWDITNTQDVTVKIYHAPTVIIENIHFQSDLDTRQYKYLVRLHNCKNSIVKNCDFTEMDNGLMLDMCVNTLVDGCTFSKSKWDNALERDGYGVCVSSCTNTIIQRVLAICAQGCLDLTGTIPVLNTFVYNCNLSSECRAIGIDMHENSYNIVMEDCTFGGLSLFGTATVNRCRIIKNMRAPSTTGIIVRGSHNPEWAKFKITNCEFSNDLYIDIARTSPQTPIQSFDNIFGSVEIENCSGFTIGLHATVTSEILSNTVKRLVVKNCRDVDHIYHTSDNVVEYAYFENVEFVEPYWIEDHSSQNLALEDIYYLRIVSEKPAKDRLFVDLQHSGDSYHLPADVLVAFASSNPDAKYVICGRNIASNDPTDYNVGTIGGSVGTALTRTPNASFANALSVDASGNLVFTQPDSTAKVAIYPICLLHAVENSRIDMTCKLKNSGSTSGAAFYPYIAIVNCETKLLTYRGNGSKQTAAASGVVATHSRTVPAGSMVMCYLLCSDPVANSVTTIEDFAIELQSYDFYEEISYSPYEGSSRIGDGNLSTKKGLNYIMSSEDAFQAKFKVDMLKEVL